MFRSSSSDCGTSDLVLGELVGRQALQRPGSGDATGLVGGVLAIAGHRAVAVARLERRQALGELVEVARLRVRVRPVGAEPLRIDREVLRVERVRRAQVVQPASPGSLGLRRRDRVGEERGQLALVEAEEARGSG